MSIRIGNNKILGGESMFQKMKEKKWFVLAVLMLGTFVCHAGLGNGH